MNCSSFWNRDSCWVEARIGRRTWENYPSNCAHLGIHLCLLCQFSWFQTRSELKRFRETWQGPTNQLCQKSGVGSSWAVLLEHFRDHFLLEPLMMHMTFAVAFATAIFGVHFQGASAWPSRAEISLAVAYSHELHHLYRSLRIFIQ
jgi:hypothetical protein